MSSGDKLMKARLAMKLSTADLAGLSGVSEQTIMAYERDIKRLNQRNVEQIAFVLGVSVAYLLCEYETDSQKNIDEERFFVGFRNEFGDKAAGAARATLSAVEAQLAEHGYDEKSIGLILESLRDVAWGHQIRARENFSPNRYKKHTA